MGRRKFSLVALFFVVAVVVTPVFAYSVIHGDITQKPTIEPTPAYSEPVTNDSKYALITFTNYTIIRKGVKLVDDYVNQGDIICSGYTYDMSGVWGWSGSFAWWSKWWLEDSQYPDVTNTVPGSKAVYAVTVDPKTWPLGNWYQIDYFKYSSNIDYYDPNWTYNYRHGNDYVFTIQNCPYTNSGGIRLTGIKSSVISSVTSSSRYSAYSVSGDVSNLITSSSSQQVQNVTYTKNSSIVINTGNGTVEIPVTVQATGVPIVSANMSGPVVTITVPTTVPTPAESATTEVPTEIPYVTPKTGIGALIVIAGLVFSGMILRRN